MTRGIYSTVSNYKSFSVMVIGKSHTDAGKECQDYSYHYPNEKYADDTMTFAVLADGHGSDDCFRSAKGARFAVECAANAMRNFVNMRNQPDVIEEKVGPFVKKLKRPKPIPTNAEGSVLIRNLMKYIITEWHDKVAKDYTATPFAATELADVSGKYQKRYAAGEEKHHAYGTTLIAVVVTPDYWFGFHLGDGRLTALYKDGSYGQPVPWDERCFLNATTSICDNDAADTARVYFCPKDEKDLPLAVFLCSDGVDDNYPVDDNEQYLFKLYRAIIQTFAEDGFESTCKQIEDLANSFATKGKGDDTSIAGVIDMEALGETAKIFQNQIEIAGAEEIEMGKLLTNTENELERKRRADGLFIRGCLYKKKSRYKEAYHDLQEAAMLNPDNDLYIQGYDDIIKRMEEKKNG